MATKQVNYSDEQAKQLYTSYQSAKSDAERAAVVAEFAAEFGKTKRSIVAKLVSMNIYRKPMPTTKAGLAIERKEKIVNDIAIALCVPVDIVGSLSAATRKALQLVRAALTGISE